MIRTSTAPAARADAPPARPGLRLVALGMFLISAAAAGAGCEPQERKAAPEVADLPQRVRDALDRAAQTYERPLAGAKWSEAVALTGSEHAIYQVRGKNGRGIAIEIEVTRGGRVVEVEERGIPMDEVPSAVRDALNARVPQFQPKQVEAVYQGGSARPVCYGFEGTDAAGKEVELYLSADGKTVLN